MKNITWKTVTKYRPDIEAIECIDFCLLRLKKDKKHEIGEEVVKDLTYEELLGALLSAKDEIKLLERRLNIF